MGRYPCASSACQHISGLPNWRSNDASAKYQSRQFKPRLVNGVLKPESYTPNLLILDGQQRLTALFMVLLSELPVSIKDQKSQKIIKKWYYLG
ncbi:MAG: hypothetical protein V7K21_15140 [Nostoc sp.]|uniref:hypothetical protein n=1 Tax=Nostoc sp. TaxID=1180 RepID=UPI002FFCC255